ncbi:ParB/RepB/Spo0J family partition protein [Paenibacillus sp. FSL L8-0708]|uniref:ParB/RepB/Spo0J family partition protein n=1 Tax=Paenibacillus sp. FSL L8-0708 TaxID=2975311 RepID=UPI0030F6E694
MSGIPIDKLRPHPSNNLYFDDLSGEDWTAFLNDVKENGIRDPLRITIDFQVICGHQRLRAAKELGLQSVPVIIEDIQEVADIERLLVEDNLHRRHLTSIQKAKLAATLKERWGIKQGKRTDLAQNGLSSIAETIGESISTTKRLIKLNDLIPELKGLVESKKLGTVFAEKLAALTPEEQKILHQTFGEEIGKSAKAEAEKNIQEIIEYEKEKIEKRYKDSIPKDVIPEMEAAIAERIQEEADILLLQKEQEKLMLLKRKEDEWKLKFKEDRENDKFTITNLRQGIQKKNEELEALKISNPVDFDEQQAELQKKKLQKEADYNALDIRIHTNNFLEKVAIGTLMQWSLAAADPSVKKKLFETISSLESFTTQIKAALNGRIIGGINDEC